MEIIKIGSKEISITSLDNLVKLANSLEDVQVKEDGSTYIKFKKDVIIESGNNLAFIADGFNIQYAKQIHFNPEFEKEQFREMLLNDFEDTKYKIVEKSAELLDRELTKEEIKTVINGGTLTDHANYDIEKAPKNDNPSCDHYGH